MNKLQWEVLMILGKIILLHVDIKLNVRNQYDIILEREKKKLQLLCQHLSEENCQININFMLAVNQIFLLQPKPIMIHFKKCLSL